MTDEHFEYFSRWYHAVVKELLDVAEFSGDFAALAGMVYPSIKVSEAEESVELLRRLGLVEWDEQGPLTVKRQFISTAGISMQALAVKNVQRKMAHLAADAIDGVAAQERDISGVSIGISLEGFRMAREELARCRQRLLEIAEKWPLRQPGIPGKLASFSAELADSAAAKKIKQVGFHENNRRLF